MITFPFAELTKRKVRPAVVITVTDDKYKDLVVSAISSVVPVKVSKREVLLKPNNINKLRVDSVIKVDRIVTLKHEDKIADLGCLSVNELQDFKNVLADMLK